MATQESVAAASDPRAAASPAGAAPVRDGADLLARLGDLPEHVACYLSAHTDLLRLRVRKAVRKAVATAILALAGAGVVVTGAVYLTMGLAGLVGDAVGGQPIGDVTAGLAVIAGCAVAVMVANRVATRRALTATMRKYEGRRRRWSARCAGALREAAADASGGVDGQRPCRERRP
jgi:hypothetical protein